MKNDPQTEWTIKHEQRKMEQDILATEAKKRKFIHEIKSGLGDTIKEEPNKPQNKLGFWGKIKRLFLNG
tara:strand:- start:903 stop:1109 length:207 start_codon:yes stop_codon:yes gene_type:complete